jgi:thiol-disulfide isomerase/thioredoxin
MQTFFRIFGRILGIMAVVCLSAICALGQSGSTAAPDKAVDPMATAAGKPVVLIFVRTDCPISNRYAPTVQQLAAKYRGSVQFWLVYPAKQDSREKIAAQTAEYGYDLPWVRDVDHVLVGRAKATITPEAALFDQAGQLRYHGRIDDLYVSFGRSRRAATKHDLDDAIEAVLTGKPVSDNAPAVGCYISDLR